MNISKENWYLAASMFSTAGFVTLFNKLMDYNTVLTIEVGASYLFMAYICLLMRGRAQKEFNPEA